MTERDYKIIITILVIFYSVLLSIVRIQKEKLRKRAEEAERKYVLAKSELIKKMYLGVQDCRFLAGCDIPIIDYSKYDPKDDEPIDAEFIKEYYPELNTMEINMFIDYLSALTLRAKECHGFKRRDELKEDWMRKLARKQDFDTNL